MIGLPGEEKEDVQDTLRLLSKLQPGRFRWTLFFPFVGTRAFEIAESAGAIDFGRMADLDNFTDETCMDLGEDVNLYVKKVKDCFCAFVNGYAQIPEYGRIVSRIESMGPEGWQADKSPDRLRDRGDRRGYAPIRTAALRGKVQPFYGREK